MQKPSEKCIKCSIVFAQYFCSVCNLYDENGIKKNIYHCDKCGICRVGPTEKVFHCDDCNICYDIDYYTNHHCSKNKNIFKGNCPVCMEDIYTSRKSGTLLECGHSMHHSCYTKYLKKGNLTCPLCKKSIIDPKIFEQQMDLQHAAMKMPEEYKNKKRAILCNDCLTKSIVPFHILPGKCKKCRSYN